MLIFVDTNLEGRADSRRAARNFERGGRWFRFAEAIVALSGLQVILSLKKGWMALVRGQNFAC
jgi:hypothetical protein